MTKLKKQKQKHKTEIALRQIAQERWQRLIRRSSCPEVMNEPNDHFFCFALL
jgi:hypothetical protein